MHIENVIFLILSKNAYTKFSAGPPDSAQWLPRLLFYTSSACALLRRVCPVLYDRMLCKIILDLLLSPTYRISMPITEIHVHWNYNSYSVCPRCKATMEREYQSFCDRCGQRLDWSKYENAEVVYTGWNGPAANEDDKQECGNQFAEHSDKSVYSS